MEPTEIQRAVTATLSIAAELGLPAEDATVLNNSNKLILRVLPADVLARVAPEHEQVAQFEIDLALRLTDLGGPIAALEPRVAPRTYERDGFVVTLWTFYDPLPAATPPAYAEALVDLHAAMRKVDLPSPHYTDRVESALALLSDPSQTPDLGAEDREFLTTSLQNLTRAIQARRPAEQLLHGEPHPGNLLATTTGPRFIDLETCCRGPVEFDLAHAPEEVDAHYPDADQSLVRDCRLLVLAMITTWRWDLGDQFPNGRQFAHEWITELRAAYR
ncbi:aminoglycoside phosphotransferase family protein [Kribbella sp. NPDC051770]|uniref:aminoglycoside phosphotransferase family protein n=1 Tax=Kribbella sp. NPDC051770 TaxID=3155413 RepID=UPI00341833F8